MTRFQYAFLLYYSAILFAALSGQYEGVRGLDMKAWDISVSLYHLYRDAIRCPSLLGIDSEWDYLSRV